MSESERARSSTRRSPRIRGAWTVPVAVLLLSAGTPSFGAAQSGRDARLQNIFSAMDDSASVRLSAPPVYVSNGRFLGLGMDSVRVKDGAGVLELHLSDITGVAVRGSKWLEVGVGTAVVGVVAGAMAGFIVGHKDCIVPDGCDRKSAGLALRWGLSFGTVGFVGGGLVGWRMGEWRTVFP